MFTYRMYNENNEYIKSCEAETYVEARDILLQGEKDKVFCVEDDGHEVECGDLWMADLYEEMDIAEEEE